MSYSQITSSTDSLLVAGKSTARASASFWLAGVDIGGVCVGHGSLVSSNAVIYCAHNAIGIGGTVRFATGEVRKVVAMERVEIAATTSHDDMFLAKLDAPVSVSPLPIVASWGGQTLNDLPVCFDRLDDCVFVQEVRNSSIGSQVQNKGNKILRFCERASQPKRVAFTGMCQSASWDQTSSNSCFVIHNGKAYFVGPAAWGWGPSGTVAPWPNVAYIDLTFYIDALKAAASKLGVALRFASFTAGGVSVDAIQQAEKPVQDYRNVILEDRPLHYWPLQDVNGTQATALIGTAMDYTNSPTLGKAGAFSTGLSVGLARASSQRGFVTGLTGFTQAITLECWVRPTALSQASGQNILTVHATSGNATLGLEITTGNVFSLYAFNGSTARRANSSALTVNTWYHVACVFTSNTSRELFVNGVSVATNTQSLTATTYTRAGIGHFLSLDHLNGDVSHAAIYNSALSAARIQYHYLAGLNGINPVLRGIGV